MFSIHIKSYEIRCNVVLLTIIMCKCFIKLVLRNGPKLWLMFFCWTLTNDKQRFYCICHWKQTPPILSAMCFIIMSMWIAFVFWEGPHLAHKAVVHSKWLALFVGIKSLSIDIKLTVDATLKTSVLLRNRERGGMRNDDINLTLITFLYFPSTTRVLMDELPSH